MRHFLSVNDLTADEFMSIIRRGGEFRRNRAGGRHEALFPRRVMAMIFEKSSTRTRVSFQSGMAQLGGHAINLSPRDTQIGRGEPIEDTARVLSQMVDIVMIRTYSQEALERFASFATVPVINGLTDLLHPCQLLADIQTWYEHRGDMSGKTVAWIGDGNNMCHSWLNTARLLNFTLRYACPPGHEPDATIVEAAGKHGVAVSSAYEACEGADLVTTDVWASMGQEDEAEARASVFADFKVSAHHMALAAKDAVFLHCLPAHRGEEVDAEVIDGPQSLVFEEAGNRLHAQKALVEFLLQHAGHQLEGS